MTCDSSSCGYTPRSIKQATRPGDGHLPDKGVQATYLWSLNSAMRVRFWLMRKCVDAAMSGTCATPRAREARRALLWDVAPPAGLLGSSFDSDGGRGGQAHADDRARRERRRIAITRHHDRGPSSSASG